MIGEENEAGHRSLGYLLLGYVLVATTSVYGVLGGLGRMAGGGLSALQSSIGGFFNILGFVVVFHSQIWYLEKTGRLSWLRKEVRGRSLRRVLALVSALILALTYINTVLVNYDFYQVDDPELGTFRLFATISLFFVAVGIMIFNILFTLLGPIYILLFYFLVVRGRSEGHGHED